MSAPLGSDPAFPVQVNSAMTGWTLANHGGLSKREWLAGTIAAGMWANSELFRLAKIATPKNGTNEGQMNKWAIDATDDLLATLERSASPTPTSVSPEPQSGS